MSQKVREIIKRVNSGNAQEVGDLLRGHVRARVDDRIERLIDRFDGDVSDLSELMNMSQRFGLQDEIDLLERYSYETLVMHVRHKRSRKKRSNREESLEGFLSENGNLALVEPGLKYVERQAEAESGIIDILARDFENRRVFVELKAEKEATRHAYDQLVGYINDPDSDRVIYVSPFIHTNLFHKLRPYYDEGIIGFVKVEGIDDENYKFVKVDHDNISELGVVPKRRNGNNKKGEVREKVRVSVINDRDGEEDKKSKKPRVFEGGEEVSRFHIDNPDLHIKFFKNETYPLTHKPRSEEEIARLDSLPFHIQLMEYFELTDNPESYVDPIEVDSGVYASLERLSDSPINYGRARALLDFSRREEIETMEDYRDFLFGVVGREKDSDLKVYEDLDIAVREAGARSNEVNSYYETIIRQFAYSAGIYYGFDSTIDLKLEEGEGIEDFLRKNNHEIHEVRLSLDERIESVNRATQVYSDAIKKIINNKHSQIWNSYINKWTRKGSIVNYLSKIDGSSIFLDFLPEFLKLKVDRTIALREVSDDLAASYLTYNAFTCRTNVAGGGDLHPVPHLSYVQALESDDRVYLHFLKYGLTVKDPVENNASRVKEGEPLMRRSSKTNLGRDLSSELRSAIVNDHESSFNDYQPWIDYLVEDISDAGYSAEDLSQFGEALSGVKFHKLFRHREDRPDMNRLETFSQDVNLRYIRHGKVPTTNDLVEIYDSLD